MSNSTTTSRPKDDACIKTRHAKYSVEMLLAHREPYQQHLRALE